MQSEDGIGDTSVTDVVCVVDAEQVFDFMGPDGSIMHVSLKTA